MNSSEVFKRRLDFHEKLKNKFVLEGFSYDDQTQFVTRPYWPYEPKNAIKPHLWKWEEVLPLVKECGELIGLGRGSSHYDRRVLALSNPGSNYDYTTSGTLFADIQLIKPGESAPCHRHTPCATRFIMQGEGGWTTVNGDRKRVRPGDIVYTGQFPWHDHGNDGPEDFIFLDVLDIPLLYFTATSSWEFDFAPITGDKNIVNQPATMTEFEDSLQVDPILRPTFSTQKKRNHEMFSYLSWEKNKAQLTKYEQHEGSECDGIHLEWTQPNGEHIGPTVSVFTQWIRPKENILSHRHTSSTIYICVEGQGYVNIENQTLRFVKNDIFVVPSWNWHNFESDKGCFLHSISDLSLVNKMQLYREQKRTADNQLVDTGWNRK